MSKLPSRLAWLDNARILAMLLMIAGHICGYLAQGEAVGAGFFQTIIVAFNMPLFVILSGYGNCGSLMRMASIKDFGISLWHSLVRVLLPVLPPMLLFCAIEQSWEPFGFETVLWFLWMLFYLMVISAVAFGGTRLCIYILNKIIKLKENVETNLRLWLSLIVMVGVAILLDRQYTCEFCTYFAVGILARHYKIFERDWLKQWWMITLVAVVSVGAYLYWFDMQSGHWFYWHGLRQMKAAGLLPHYALRQIIATGISLAVILLTIRLSKTRTRFSDWGKHTLAMYIVQDIFMRYNDVFGFAIYNPYFGWLQILAMLMLIVALSLGVVKSYDYVKSLIRGTFLTK